MSKQKDVSEVLNNPKKIHMRNIIIIISCILCLSIIIFSIVNRFIGGEYTFIRSDLQGQMVPAYRMFWNNLMNGNGLIYSFQFSLGMVTLPLYEFYAAFCPLNIIYLLVANDNIATFILVIFKFILAGVCFYEYERAVLNKVDFSSVFFAICYGLSGYLVVYYYNVLYMDGVYMLPVVIICIDLLIKRNKAIPLIMAYAYLFLC